jgi:hypothetical protein
MKSSRIRWIIKAGWQRFQCVIWNKPACIFISIGLNNRPLMFYVTDSVSACMGTLECMSANSLALRIKHSLWISNKSLLNRSNLEKLLFPSCIYMLWANRRLSNWYKWLKPFIVLVVHFHILLFCFKPLQSHSKIYGLMLFVCTNLSELIKLFFTEIDFLFMCRGIVIVLWYDVNSLILSHTFTALIQVPKNIFSL